MNYHELTLYENEIRNLRSIREREDVALNILLFLKAICYKRDYGGNGSGLQCFYYPNIHRFMWGNENKSIHSLSIPWKIEEDEETRCFLPRFKEYYWKNEYCDMLTCLFNDIKNHGGCLEGMYSIYDGFSDMLEQFHIENKTDENNLWAFFISLYTYESGYVRYDYDPINEDGHLHPIHHLDVNYSSRDSYKIGLNRHMSFHELAELIDVSTDCYYAEKVV